MKRVALTAWIVVASVLPVDAGDRLDGGPNLSPESKGIHRTITGTVENMTGNQVHLKTEEGTTRVLAFKTARQEGLGMLKVGDRVVLELDEGNQIIDMRRADAAPQPNDREVRGTVTRFFPLNKVIMVEAGGTLRVFGLKDAAVTKLNNVQPGDHVVLEVDSNGLVADAHRPG